MTRHPFLGDISPATFLNEYWQKKPLLLKQAIPDFSSFLNGDELAGLSLEEEIESRLVIREANGEWALQKGPFNEESFAELPKDHWSLLIQGADQWIDEVNALMREIDFIPSWRIDDVMISYATDGGSVGPHYDNYDVFLLQAEGQRTWKLGHFCDHTDELQSHPQLKLLSNMVFDQEYILEPGDMLYVPTRLAHHGVSQGNSISYSFGFRAPATTDILGRFCDEISSHLHPEDRYYDADIQLPSHPAEIDAEALNRVRELIQQSLDQPETLRRWFGSFVTEPKHDEMPELPEDVDMTPLDTVQLSPGHRIAYCINENELQFFADGICLKLDNALLPLCKKLGYGKPVHSPFPPPELELLTKLLTMGTIEEL